VAEALNPPARDDPVDVIHVDVRDDPGPEATAEAGAPPPPAARGSSRYGGRFWLVYALLGGVLAFAAAIAVAVAISPKPGPDRSWSLWHPGDGGVSGAKQIANHVGPLYHLPDGNQLVVVQAGPLEFASLPATIALRSGSNNISLLEGKSVLYTLCGLGPRCAIRTGKPSPQRHLLLRRESLELALYSFHYLDVDQVVTLLPPRKGQKASQAMLFREQDVNAELDQPLRATLPAPVPLPSALNGPQGSFIARVTASNLFKFSLEQGQDASVFLVLDKIVS
jgi:hypothetical protein